MSQYNQSLALNANVGFYIGYLPHLNTSYANNIWTESVKSASFTLSLPNVQNVDSFR